MLGDWVVGVFLRFNSNGVATMSRLAASTNAANDRLAFQQKLIDRNELSMRQYNRQIEAHRLGWLNLGTAAAGAVALAGGAAIAFGVKGAADIQRELTGVAIALRTSPNNPMLARMAFNVSGMTAQDATTISREMATAATSGLNSPKYFQEAFTRIAKAADVLWMSPKHIDPVDAVRQMSTLAHLFGTYQGPGFQHMIDRAVQMMYVQPEALQSLITQGRLFVGAGLSRGVSEEDLFKQAMIMGQTSFLRSRGGSGLARVIEYLSGAATITGHLSKIQHAAMFQLGLTANGALRPQYLDHGKLQLQKIVDHLEHIRNSFTPTEFGNLITNAFLAQGGRYLNTILQPNVYKKAQENWAVMNKLGGVDKLWHQYTNNFLYQYNIFSTNFANLFKAVFLPMLPELTTLFMDMGKALGKAVSWLVAHPDAAKRIGEAIIALTGVAGIRVAAGTLLGLARFSGILTGLDGAIPILTRVGLLIDNVFFMGLGRTAIPWLDRMAGAVLGLGSPISTAIADLGGLKLALWGLVPVIGELTLTSFMPQRDARQNLIKDYGYAYWKYLKARHPGTDPYSFDPDQGDLTPAQFNRLYNKNTGKPLPRMFNPNNFDTGSSFFNPKRLQDRVTTHTQRMVERVQSHVTQVHHRIEKTAERVAHTVQHVNIQKIELVLPKGTPKRHADMLLQHLMNVGGEQRTSAYVPRPLVVRSA